MALRGKNFLFILATIFVAIVARRIPPPPFFFGPDAGEQEPQRDAHDSARRFGGRWAGSKPNVLYNQLWGEGDPKLIVAP